MATMTRLGEHRSIETETSAEMRMRVVADVGRHASDVRAAQQLKVTAAAVRTPRTHMVTPASTSHSAARAVERIHFPLLPNLTNQPIERETGRGVGVKETSAEAVCKRLCEDGI